MERPAHAGLRHLALNVRQFDEMKRFYVDVLGFAVEWEPDPDNVYLSSGIDNLALHRSTPLTTDRSTPLTADRSTPLTTDRSTPLTADRSTPLTTDRSTPLTADRSTASMSDQPALADLLAAAGSPAAADSALDHLGLIVREAADVDRWASFLEKCGVALEARPRTHRDGARSCYFRDPDGNRVQIIHHPPISRKI